MTDILEKISRYKREEIKEAKRLKGPGEMESDARLASAVRGFRNSIEQKLALGHYALIAEIKKASPSKGLIRSDFDPPGLARAYESGGAACLSVLTDIPSFQGHPDYLSQARNATALPVLRKDFMLDPYQVAETRALGADCILIILAAVSDEQALELESAAETWGMDVLAEVHNEEEVERALKLKTRLIGVNNRNLKTFETSLETTERLASLIPDDRIIISESGLYSHQDLVRLAKSGARTFLIGESLMRQDDIEAATAHLLNPQKLKTNEAAAS